MQFGPGPAETSMRLRSHLIRKHVLEFDSRRALMRRHRFSKYSHQNSGTVPVSDQCLNAKLFMPEPRRQCSGTKCEHSLWYLGYQRFVCNNRPKRTKRMSTRKACGIQGKSLKIHIYNSQPRQLKLYVQTRQRNNVEIEKYMYLFFSLNWKKIFFFRLD